MKKKILIALVVMTGLGAALSVAVPAVADSAAANHVHACANPQGKPACIDVWRIGDQHSRKADYAVGYTAPHNGRYRLEVHGNRVPIKVFEGEAKQGQPFGGKVRGRFFHPWPQQYRGVVKKWTKIGHRPDVWGWREIGLTPPVSLR